MLIIQATGGRGVGCINYIKWALKSISKAQIAKKISKEVLSFFNTNAGQYDVKKCSLQSVMCSNEYEVLALAVIEPDLLIVASGSPDVKVKPLFIR
jgi:hypothetical protein